MQLSSAGSNTGPTSAGSATPHGAISMHRAGGPPPRRRSRSRSRSRDRRDDRDRRGTCYDDRGGGRSDDARARMPGYDDRRDGGGMAWLPRPGTDDRDRRDGGGRAWGPRFGTDDGRVGRAPQQLGTRQVEARYDSLDFQHRPRSELTAHSSGARRDPSPRWHEEPSRRRGEPQRRCDEPPRRRDEPHRGYDDPSRKLRPPPPPPPPPRLPPPMLPPPPPPSRPPPRPPPPPLPPATPRTHLHCGQRDGEAAAAAEPIEAEAAGGLPELLRSPALAGLYVIVGRGALASGSGDRSLEEGELYDSSSLRQKRKHPESAASAAPTRRAVDTPSSA